LPLTPPDSPVVKQLPKAPIETDPDAIEPDDNAAPATPPASAPAEPAPQ